MRSRNPLPPLLAAFFLALFSMGVAYGATLLGVQVTPNAGGARVSILFRAAAPAGWSLEGNGTQQLVVVLPKTQGAHGTSFGGVNNVVGVNVTARDSSTIIVIQLSSSETVSYSEHRNSIVVDVPAVHALGHFRAVTKANSEPAGSLEPMQGTAVMRLRYADVSEVAGVLGATGTDIPPNDSSMQMGSVFSLPTQNGVSAFQSETTPIQQAVAPLSVGQRIDDHIAIDRRLNAVILSGTPAEIGKMRALVTALDVPVPSVMLECEVVELSNQGQKDVGFDFTQSAGGPIGEGSASLGSLNGLTTGSTANVPLFTGNFMGKLYATIAKGNGKVLAFPRILAQGGIPAQILTGDAIPIISTTVFPGPPVTTQTSINYITVGVNLQIVSRIADDGDVTSRVFTEVSSVTSEMSTPQGNVPEISLRQASTTATVRDGQSFVIGGLLEDQEFHNLSKIPILSSLPIIGELFKVEHDTESTTNLFVIVTPRVVKPSEEIKPPNGLPTPNITGPSPDP